MAEFDTQGPSDESKHNQAAQNESCCGGHSCGGGRDQFDSGNDSFISDWSGAETRLEAQAAAFEASHAEPRKPEQFWVDLVASQQPQEGEGSTALARRTHSETGVQSGQFWAELVASQRGPNALWGDLVRSQRPAASDASGAAQDEAFRYASATKPTGMGWSDGEADEWAPPERTFEPVQPAGEPVEADATTRRDDVEWGAPASAEQDWATARSEGLAYDPTSEERPSLMAAAVEAAQQQTRAKKTRKPAAKKAVAKQAKAKKPASKAKKPAAKKAAAKKPAAKRVVKKAAPAPKITKAPTRRAA
jgi:hypothetical protein